MLHSQLLVEVGRAGLSQTPNTAKSATLSTCGTSVPTTRGGLMISKQYSSRWWLCDTRSIQVVSIYLRVLFDQCLLRAIWLWFIVLVDILVGKHSSGGKSQAV